MSEHDHAPDPIDQAYRGAEALLHDDAARADRRARLLAALARETGAQGTGAPAEAAPPSRRPAVAHREGRHGRWLAAAGVTGLILFAAVHMDLGRRQEAPPRRSPVAASAPVLTKAAPTAPSRLQAAAANPPAPPPVRTHETSRSPIPSAPTAPVTVEAFTGRAPDRIADLAEAPQPPAVASPERRARAVSAAAAVQDPSDAGVRLRTAAGAGQTAAAAALLAQGAAIDAADADGYTALMWSIVGDHPDTAALLYRRGASLDRRNVSGLSARDMARARNDPELSLALGLDP